ncbi:DUF72 domain-containing protein [Pseudomonas sp. G11-1]|uniref:DUF72 domain-containing protein n=1 Tax=Halopseudomonas bauzanensis TaxID=653930 RepID=A0A4U0YP72_9GAMM|nr:MULTISPECIES: DUF72 domain-containing protein [Halopseudomonas]MCO5786403.1 DUF72 domain-containing protein [Pseudomonas sp. G11-1]MCO5789629.1 DUF72 domain-containing protein [Pseudomonas sp. G11-2]EZQ18506.1 hypothetical protein CF98_16490 [Halopseudomonas bauzanensis]TKA92419.1 DUF72 domain-containing protein [Halopseudomonas bauzanensis]WGK62675.1 DUF72 domain-containing protein [Halopseudomonas sp. SMJS2]
MSSDIRIGISGWRYEPWRGDFYPEGLLQRRELEYASRTVSSIEINGSFYALQTPERFSNWRDSTPDDFVFSVKAPRYITHVKRLRELDEPLANFFASGPLQLERKLGAFLWQFPPSFRYDPALFTELFEQLPRTFGEAVQCAARSPRFPAPEGLTTGAKTRLRHAVEIRHRSFMQEGFIELLRKHRIALVVADTAGKWPLVEELTADFMYLRLHGDKELYSSGYDDSALDDWARRIRAWAGGKQPEGARRLSEQGDSSSAERDIYCYFDNDIKVRAPYDARQLLEKLGRAEGLEIKPGQLPERFL